MLLRVKYASNTIDTDKCKLLLSTHILSINCVVLYGVYCSVMLICLTSHLACDVKLLNL